MRTSSPLVLSVRELLEAPASRRSLEFDAPVPDLGVGLLTVPGGVHFDLTFEAIEGGVLVRGTLSGESVGECRRCLKPVTERFVFKGTEMYRPPGDVWEEGYVIRDETVDLEPLARDTVALNLSRAVAGPLCREDCAGLCPRCGADLNDGACGCPDDSGDPRWSALRELRNGLNG